MAGPLGYALSGFAQGFASTYAPAKLAKDQEAREAEREKQKAKIERDKSILSFTTDTIKEIDAGASKDVINARMDVLFREYGVDPKGDLAKTISKLSTSTDDAARKRGRQLLSIAALQPDQVLAFEEMFSNEPIKAVNMLEKRVAEVFKQDGGDAALPRTFQGEQVGGQPAVFGIDPRSGKQLYETPIGAPGQGRADPALTQRIEALMSTGVDRQTAVGIATGRLVESRDPVTGEAAVVDKATGLPWRGASGAGAPPPSPEEQANIPDVLKGAVPLNLTTGVQGAVYGAMNRIADAFGARVPSPETLQGANAIKGVQLGVRNALMSETEGRDTNALRAEYDSLLVSPNSIFQGPADALDKLEQQGRILDKEIARIQTDILPGRVSPAAKSAAAQNLSQLIQYKNALDVMLGRAKAKGAAQPQQPQGGAQDDDPLGLFK